KPLGVSENISLVLPRPGRHEVVTIGHSTKEDLQNPGSLEVWSLEQRKRLRSMSPDAGYYSALALSIDGAHALAGREGILEQFDLDSGKLVGSSKTAGW